MATDAEISNRRCRGSKPSHHHKDRAKYSCSEQPPTMANTRGDSHRMGGVRGGPRDVTHDRAGERSNSSQQEQHECTEGPPDGDMSDSSLSAHDGGGGRVRRYQLGRSKKKSSRTGTTSESSLVSTYDIDAV